MAYFRLRAASPLIFFFFLGGGVAVPFYPVQDCSPISDEHRLRKSSPFFEITWRGWTSCPCFQVDFSFDSYYGRKLRFASSNWKKELGKGYRYYRNTEMLHKEAPRLNNNNNNNIITLIVTSS